MPIEIGCGGAGLTVAIINSGSPPLISDVNEFLAYFGINRVLPPFTTRFVNASTYTDIFESTLDTDMVASLAPDANVVLYQTDDTVDGDAEAMNAVAADNTASVLTTSCNDCESFGEDVYASQNSAAEQLAAQGITVIADAGDTGYQTCFFNPGIATPGDSPYVVAVGGVQPLQASTAYRSYSGWSGSAGGTSQFAKKPLYQIGVAACGGAYRCVPDIALASGTGTYPVASTATEGVYDYVDGVSNAVSGTSESAPMFAAMQIEADQFAGRRMGAINPLLYLNDYLLGGNHPRDPLAIFTDVTTGTSGSVSANRGWDFITGLGVPDGLTLATFEVL